MAVRPTAFKVPAKVDAGMGIEREFRSAPRFGVEEEFLVVDPVTRDTVPQAEVVVRRAEKRLGPRVCGEITKLQVETKTEPCHTTVDGADGYGIDIPTGQPVPVVELADRLLQAARPALEELDDLDRVTGWLRRLISDGDGATRQRRVAAPRGRLTDVVDHLIAQTVPQPTADPRPTNKGI